MIEFSNGGEWLGGGGDYLDFGDGSNSVPGASKRKKHGGVILLVTPAWSHSACSVGLFKTVEEMS